MAKTITSPATAGARHSSVGHQPALQRNADPSAAVSVRDLTFARERDARLAADLRIEIECRSHVIWRGSAAQLRSEHVLPETVSWPVKFEAVEWTDSRYSYTLQRRRPTGMRGPRSAWAQLDYWALVRREDGSSPIGAEIYRRQQELSSLLRASSASGQLSLRKYFAARCDAAYRAFLDSVLPAEAAGVDRRVTR